jgi:site-specific recombinase XerD
MTKKAIIHKNTILPPALVQAVELWAQAKSDPTSKRYHDLLRDKQQALLADGEKGACAGFFMLIRKTPDQVTVQDIVEWQLYLDDMNLAPASIYARLSRLSSFYEWLMTEPRFKAYIHTNPVKLARPKAPKAYQTPKSQALLDDEARDLLAVVRHEATRDNLSAKRDYALLRFYFATGKRREEIIGLHWGDLRFTSDAIIVQTREKGGLYRATEINDTGVKHALFAYLKATERWDDGENAPLMEKDSPLWLRHDRASHGKQALTSHGFVKMFKQYASKAGLGDIHLHQTRHTVARIVGEDAGDLTEVQTLLGHQNIATTRVYLNRIAVKKDKHSQKIAKRLLNDD